MDKQVFLEGILLTGFVFVDFFGSFKCYPILNSTLCAIFVLDFYFLRDITIGS